jgi:hypothetical protein
MVSALETECDEPLSNFAFKFNLRRYSKGQRLHGKWRHADYIEATHNQVDVHVFANRPAWNIIPIEGLHNGLRCGNKDRDRYILAAMFLGVTNYDELLKEISPRLTPFGVMGFSGGDLWEFVDAFGVHIPAVFRDLISDELMETICVFARLRAWCLRIVSKVAPTEEEIEIFVGDTTDRAVRGLAEKCGRLQNVIGEKLAAEVKAGILKRAGVSEFEGQGRVDWSTKDYNFEPMASVREDESEQESADEEDEQEDEQEEESDGGDDATTSPVTVFLMGPGGVSGTQTAGEAAAAAAAAVAATAAIIADATAAAASLRRAAQRISILN